jgi:hypothetical protein
MLKFTGRGEYDILYNPSKGDGWMWASMVRDFGEDEVNKMYAYVVENYNEPKVKLRWY